MINHDKRLDLGLKANEYMVADSIYHLSNNPKFTGEINKSYLADFFDIDRKNIGLIIKRLIEKGILSEDGNRTTELWYNTTVGEAKHPTEGGETPHNNNIYKYIAYKEKKEKLSERQIEELKEFAEDILSSLGANEDEEGAETGDPLTQFSADEIANIWNSITIPYWKKINTQNKNTKIWKDYEKLWKKRRLEYTQEQFFAGLEEYLKDIKSRNTNTDYSKHRFTLYEWIKQSNALQKFAQISGL